MSDVAIRVEGLGKQYQIRRRAQYKTLRDTLTDSVLAPFRSIRSRFRAPVVSESHNEPFWALKNLSFEVPRGTVIGVIGRNGAGKSTLLKILSRITEPTEGCVEIHGRVASLLEVGTGFHPELTGRENIFLNGAILGMPKIEITRKFDEIVAFAEIDKFIDTPAKHYSSGMYMRLAFAVAAHVEPQILVVDEVLAVGDLGFQRKCLGKMGEVARIGRTVVLVSHQMNQIRRLCSHSVWLDRGVARAVGKTVEVVSSYEAAMTTAVPQARGESDGDGTARFLKWEILEPHHSVANVIATLGPVKLRLSVKVNKPIRNGHHGIALFNNDGVLMWASAVNGLDLKPGVCDFQYSLSSLPLKPGPYRLQVSLFNDGELVDSWHCVPDLIIGTEPLTHPLDDWQGVLNQPCEFTVR
jgi:lipopolysaccharide transport system ATP-binding protein